MVRSRNRTVEDEEQQNMAGRRDEAERSTKGCVFSAFPSRNEPRRGASRGAELLTAAARNAPRLPFRARNRPRSLLCGEKLPLAVVFGRRRGAPQGKVSAS
ncbi:hypothetical protein GN956_G15162 [Arapaima gigas]